MIDILIIILLIFQGTLKNYFYYFGYLDEIILVIYFIRMIILLCFKKKEIKLYRCEIINLGLLIAFYSLGIISSYMNKIQGLNFSYIINGILVLKPLIVFYLARITIRDIKYKKKHLEIFYNFLRGVLWIYFIISIINIKFNFLKYFDVRNGIRTVAIGFSHVSELDFFVISSTVILLFLVKVLEKDYKEYFIMFIPMSALIIFSGRTKAISFLSIYLLILLIIIYFKNIKIKNLIFFIPIVFWISLDRIKMSIISNEAARGALYNTSIKIATDYFPLGSGFGTFGTSYSAKNYSELYSIYNINNIWGLSENNASFIMDTQWASILAETGILGMIIYMIISFIIFYMLWNISKDVILKIAISSLYIYTIMSSIAEPIFSSYKGVAIFIISAFFINIIKMSEEG